MGVGGLPSAMALAIVPGMNSGEFNKEKENSTGIWIDGLVFSCGRKEVTGESIREMARGTERAKKSRECDGVSREAGQSPITR